MSKKAFTLIELLIVVAIIAILAAIAVPNFLEAQVRSKVSRCKNDMRTIAVAIEAYAVDQNKYPFTRETPYPLYLEDRYKLLTTPVAYISSAPLDPFGTGKPGVPIKNASGVLLNTSGNPLKAGDKALYAYYDFLTRDSTVTFPWTVAAADPLAWWDSVVGGMGVGDPRTKGWYLSGAGPDRVEGATDTGAIGVTYDPTNGTMSHGDIVRFGP